MKKSLALILAVVMALSLTACGSSSTPSATPEPEPTATATPTPEPTEEPTPEPTEEPTPEPTEEPAPALTLGEYDEVAYTYTNDFLGLGIQLDEEWIVFSQEEIAANFSTAIGRLTDENLAEQFESTGSVTVFSAQIQDGLVNFNIGIEDIGKLYSSFLDEQAYAELGKDSILRGMEGLGATDVQCDIISTVFAGAEHTAISVRSQIMEYEIYQTAVCIKEGRYMAIISITSFFEDALDVVQNMFYAL